MVQKYSVFSNRSCLVFHNNPEEKFEKSHQMKYFEDIQSLKTLFDQWINEPDKTHWVVFDEQPERTVDFLFRHVAKPIEAAGCIVKNRSGKMLMMKRLGKWDLPKGKIDKGETPASAAIRELEEETGVSVSEVIQLLDYTYHLYEMKGQLVFKKTWWFAATINFTGTLIPQTEEHIEELVWMDVNDRWLEENKHDTYDSIYELLKKQLN